MGHRFTMMWCLLLAAPAAAQVSVETESNRVEAPGNIFHKWNAVSDFVADAGTVSQALPRSTPPGSLVGHSTDRQGRVHVLVDRGLQPGPGRFAYDLFANEAAYLAGVVQESANIDLVLVRDRALAFAIDPMGGFHLVVDQFEGTTDLLVSWTDRAGFLSGSGRTASTLRRPAAGCIPGRVCEIVGLSFDRLGRVHQLHATETSTPGETLLTHFTFDNVGGLLSGEPVVTSVGFKPALDNRVAGFDISIAGVPEPGSWALMIGGFAMLGAAVRRRVRLQPDRVSPSGL
jgi:hypothetical protein